jgi:hypothetical protein
MRIRRYRFLLGVTTCTVTLVCHGFVPIDSKLERHSSFSFRKAFQQQKSQTHSHHQKRFHKGAPPPSLLQLQMSGRRSITSAPQPVLLAEAEGYLAASSLVYTYAELRQLAYCGYTRTSFEEVDCNQDGIPITVFKLLEIMLKERDWLVDRRLNPPPGEEWRSDIL